MSIGQLDNALYSVVSFWGDTNLKGEHMVKSAALRNKESRERRKVSEMELRESLFNNIEVFTETWEDGAKAITIEWNLTPVDQMAVEIQAKHKGLTVEEFLDATGRRIINQRLQAAGGGKVQRSRSRIAPDNPGHFDV